MATTTRNRTASTKPIHQIRDGALSVSIWERQHEGRTYYSANPQRAYTTDDGKTFEHTDSFNSDDLPRVSRLLDMSYAWIVTRKGQAR